MPVYDQGRFNPPAPLARVSLRHPEKGTTLPDLPMLIDSGADVSLIPQLSVNQVGVPVIAGDGYELMGFDGNRSVARAVQLDLLFLRRAFKGRFLLIDQEWGILGRDVLNHVPILLNGPLLTWCEQVYATSVEKPPQ
jgi:hypothetical protein